MKQVFACVDGSRVTESVCDASVWVATRVNVPLTFLHALEHENAPVAGDLSGSIGLGAREDLLSEMIELEAQKAALELKQGKLVLEAVSNRAREQGVDQIRSMQRHGSLTDTRCRSFQIREHPYSISLKLKMRNDSPRTPSGTETIQPAVTHS